MCITVGGRINDVIEVLIGCQVFHVGIALDFDLRGALCSGHGWRCQLTNVGEVSYNGGGGSHDGGHQMCAATCALSTFEIPV